MFGSALLPVSLQSLRTQLFCVFGLIVPQNSSDGQFSCVGEESGGGVTSCVDSSVSHSGSTWAADVPCGDVEESK